MAPKSCPVCKHQNYEFATSCTSCGHPLKPKDKPSESEGFLKRVSSYYQRQTASTRRWILITGVASVFTLSVLGVAIYGLLESTNPKTSNPELDRQLCEAAIEGEYAKLQVLVKNGADVNSRIYNNSTPLILAILSAAPHKVDDSPSMTKRLTRLQMVRFLLDNGADVNLPAPVRSPLAVARVVDDDKELEELLIKSGANPDTAAQEGEARNREKKLTAGAMRLVYHLEVSTLLEEAVNKEKRKIIEGNK